MPIASNQPFPDLSKPLPTDPNPVDDMPATTCYRFSGYNLPLDGNGFYVVEFQDQSQPSDWSRQAVSAAYYGDLG